MKNGILAFLFLYPIYITNCCNEAVCGSIVSKCLLTQQCTCDLNKNCTCCKSCFNCLSDLYSECCSCLGMCPTSKDTLKLSENSHVEDLLEPVPGLFKLLTEEEDEQNRWQSATFPVDIDISLYGTRKEVKIYMQSAEQNVLPKPDNILTINCTVAYMSKCLSLGKCKASCESMGASSYRWFHDACCECVGENCINYGINENRCGECSEELAEFLDETDMSLNLDDYDFDTVYED